MGLRAGRHVPVRGAPDRNDGFGTLKQVFARGYAEGDAAEATFPEDCQRPRVGDADEEVAITFAEETVYEVPAGPVAAVVCRT